MTQERDRPGNGREPLHLIRPKPGALPYEVAARAVDALCAVESRINEIDDDVQKLTIAVLAMPETIRGIVADALRGRPYRDPEASWHDYDAEWERAGRELRAMVKDPAHPKIDSDRVKAIAQEAVLAAKEGAELSAWRRVKSIPRKLAWEAVKALVPLIVGGVAVYVWHLLTK